MADNELEKRLKKLEYELEKTKTENQINHAVHEKNLKFLFSSRTLALQIALASIAILVTVVFSYQVYKTEQVRELEIKLDQKMNQAEQLQHDYLIVLETTGKIIDQLVRGYYHLDKKQLKSVHNISDRAIKTIDDSYKQKIFNKDSLLQNSLNQLKLAFLTLKLRASFYAKKFKELTPIALQMLEYDKKNRIAYTFLGISIANGDKNPTGSIPHFENALKYCEQQIGVGDCYAAEQNLIETYFKAGQYAQIIKTVPVYLEKHHEYKNHKGEGYIQGNKDSSIYIMDWFFNISIILLDNKNATIELEKLVNILNKEKTRLSLKSFELSAFEDFLSDLNSSKINVFNTLGQPVKTKLANSVKTLIGIIVPKSGN